MPAIAFFFQKTLSPQIPLLLSPFYMSYYQLFMFNKICFIHNSLLKKNFFYCPFYPYLHRFSLLFVSIFRKINLSYSTFFAAFCTSGSIFRKKSILKIIFFLLFSFHLYAHSFQNVTLCIFHQNNFHSHSILTTYI